MSLTERLRTMLDEASEEVTQLEARKAELAEERDAAITAAKQRYTEAVAPIDEELATTRRLQRALYPPEPKPAKPKTPTTQARMDQWRPRPENFTHVFRAMSEGAETVSDIAEVVPVSSATVKIVLDHGRRDGTVRLAGTVKRGSADAKTYRLTPDGEEALKLSTENGAHVVSAT